MANMQIFPSVPTVIHKGVEVSDPSILDQVPAEWRGEQRIIIQDDGSVFVGINPARKMEDVSGLGLIDEMVKVPAVAKALQDRAAARERQLEDRIERAINESKCETHVMSVIAKKADMTFWTPTMPGYEEQFLDPVAGDRMYSRGRDAERDGYKPGVAYPTLKKTKRGRR